MNDVARQPTRVQSGTGLGFTGSLTVSSRKSVVWASATLQLVQNVHPAVLTMFVPTVENIEAYLQHVEEVVVTTVSQATPDMQSVKQVAQRLQEDLARFWPSSLPQLPEIKLGNLGPFEVPPPPPPPPPARGLFEKSADWVGAHPWKTAGIGIGIVGAGLLVGYGGIYYAASPRTKRVRATGVAHDGERRQVVGEHRVIVSCMNLV